MAKIIGRDICIYVCILFFFFFLLQNVTTLGIRVDLDVEIVVKL